MRRLFLFILLFGLTGVAHGQQADSGSVRVGRAVPVVRDRVKGRMNPYLADTLLEEVPLGRKLFHDKIDNEQKTADAADGATDGRIVLASDVAHSGALTQALLHDVDGLQVLVENMPANGRDGATDNQLKLQYLRALRELLQEYNTDPRQRVDFYVKLVANMRDMLIAANEDKLMDFLEADTSVQSLENGRVLLDNHAEERAFIYSSVGRQFPVMMARRLGEFAKDTFAQAIIRDAARLNPKLVFGYAISSNIGLKSAVYKTEDPLVQAIVQVAANSEAPLKAFPLLADVYYKRKTVEEIDRIAADPALYYERLVWLKLENEPLTRQVYTDELEYRTLKYFVRQMNELHDTADAVRFRCIDSLPASSLYFIMVNGQDEIYTSSFLGTFRRMLERMKPLKGNELLDSLHYDHFRTFIRMCAGYNTLSEFLATMDEGAKTEVMSRFAGGLQQGAADELEDAVDVADAFGSIRDSALFVFLQKKVKENYEQSKAQDSKKGMAIYSLLGKLIEGNRLSSTDTGAATASAKLKLPPINKVPYSSLVNDSGTVYERVFFYGDEDGKTAYEGFMTDYSKNAKWRVTKEKYWTAITSVTGKRVVMYANLPLKEPDDEVAIDSLDKYFYDNNIHPSVVIHRGHSYHVKTTLERIDTCARIVVLGSCGGYHNLAVVLGKSPEAHIISSKQTGVGAINEPIMRALNAQLLEGADVNWIAMWKELDDYFVKRKELYDKFTDYVPPYKNLGVIFIKAYKRMVN